MRSIEIEWKGKKEQVFYDAPTRGERKIYLKGLNDIRNSLKGKEGEVNINAAVEAVEYREDFALARVKKSPFEGIPVDDLPTDILKVICKAVEKEMTVSEDFQDSSNSVQSTEQP